MQQRPVGCLQAEQPEAAIRRGRRSTASASPETSGSAASASKSGVTCGVSIPMSTMGSGPRVERRRRRRRAARLARRRAAGSPRSRRAATDRAAPSSARTRRATGAAATTSRVSASAASRELGGLGGTERRRQPGLDAARHGLLGDDDDRDRQCWLAPAAPTAPRPGARTRSWATPAGVGMVAACAAARSTRRMSRTVLMVPRDGAGDLRLADSRVVRHGYLPIRQPASAARRTISSG